METTQATEIQPGDLVTADELEGAICEVMSVGGGLVVVRSGEDWERIALCVESVQLFA